MIADISKVKLHSESFAELVKAYSPIKELEDGVVYVKTNNESNWNAEVCRVKDYFANCSMRSTWLIKYDIDVLPEELYQNKESDISNLMGTESNLIMPIFLPDRMEQYYLVGFIPSFEHLESAISFLSIDAQNIILACLPYALSVMEDRNLESISQGIYEEKLTDEWAEEVKRLNASVCEFRGMVAPNPLAIFGEAAVKSATAIKKGLVSYKDRRELIKALPLVGKKMRSEDSKLQEEAKIEYAQAIKALDEHEMVLLLHALIKDAKPKYLKNILAAIADREALGMQTKYKIVFKPYESSFKEYGLKDYFKTCIFVAEGEILHPLKMSKSAMVIYTMTLIEKVTKNNENAIVNVKENNKAFNEVYSFLFCDFNKDKTQELFDNLFKRNKDKPNVPIRTGRLSENYGDIEASLQNAFKDLDEDYSPFLANSTTPLAINAEKIILPSELKAVEIR